MLKRRFMVLALSAMLCLNLTPVSSFAAEVGTNPPTELSLEEQALLNAVNTDGEAENGNGNGDSLGSEDAVGNEVEGTKTPAADDQSGAAEGDAVEPAGNETPAGNAAEGTETPKAEEVGTEAGTGENGNEVPAGNGAEGTEPLAAAEAEEGGAETPAENDAKGAETPEAAAGTGNETPAGNVEEGAETPVAAEAGSGEAPAETPGKTAEDTPVVETDTPEASVTEVTESAPKTLTTANVNLKAMPAATELKALADTAQPAEETEIKEDADAEKAESTSTSGITETDNGSGYDISGSKTASPTELTKDSRKTTVTLSLPSGEAKYEYDVVFVMDSSSSTKNSNIDFSVSVKELLDAVTEKNAKIKVGVIKCRGRAFDTINLANEAYSGLVEYSEATADVIKAGVNFTEADLKALSSGTNMHGGLVMAENLLEADTAVEASHKFVVLLMDGKTYIWNNEKNEPTTYYTQYMANKVAYGTPAIGQQTGAYAKSAYVHKDNIHYTNTSGDPSQRFYFADFADLYARTDKELSSTETKYDYYCAYADKKGSTAGGTLVTSAITNTAGIGGSRYVIHTNYYNFTPSEDWADLNWLEAAPYEVIDNGDGTYAFDFESPNPDFYQVHPDSLQKGLYLTAHKWTDMTKKYNTAAVIYSGWGSGSGLEIAKSFDGWIKGEGISDYAADLSNAAQVEAVFDSIRQDIIYLVNSGTVTDKIPSDFTLVENGTDTFRMTKGGEAITVSADGENAWNFGAADEGVYPYRVEYTPKTESEPAQFKWIINVPIENANPVTLSYDLEIDEESEDGEYDTNISAVLDYKTSQGKKGTYEFEIPKVTYKTPDYTVTYADGVGGTAFTDQVTEGLKSGTPTPAFGGETPTRENYVFDGWDPEVAETVTEDATYTAQWKPCTPAEGGLKIRKEIAGDKPEEDAAFAFTLEGISNTTALNAMPMPEGSDGSKKTIRTTGSGEADFGVISFSNVGTYVYNVKEEDTGVSGYTYDTAAYQVTYEVTQNGEQLEAARSISKDGTAVDEIVIINTYKEPEAGEDNPKVKKEVTGDKPSEDAVFTFTLEAVSNTAGVDTMPMPEGSEGTKKTVEITGSGEAEFGAISFSKAGTYTYKVTEKNTGEKGYTYDTSSYEITYEVTRNADKFEVSGSISKDGTAADEIVFTNKYEEPEYDPAEHDPPVRKVLTGDTPSEDAVFTFTLEAVSNTAGLDSMPMPEGSEGKKKTVEITGSGETEFGIIRFTKVGTYVYTIKEEDSGAEGYTYDTATYQITYKVTRNGDKMEAARTYTRNGAAADDIVFTNSYEEPEPTPGPQPDPDPGSDDPEPTPTTPTTVNVVEEPPGVLGVIRNLAGEVLGANREEPGEVLGANRRTGDESRIYIYAAFAVLSLAAIITVLFTKVRRHR